MRIANLIGGRLVAPIKGEYIENYEPATGEVFSEIPRSSDSDVDHAVAAAKTAFTSWSRTPAEERSRVLLRIADLIDRNLEELAALESRDNGKPVSLARRMDIPRAVANFRFFATAILHDHDLAHHTDGRALNYVIRRPIGVAGLISPWNLPLYLLTWKIAPAIATGNTCVAKPSELTPMTAHRLSELMLEAGLPDGVVNIVHGYGAEAGDPLTRHADVPLISFTGGTVTGAAVMRNAGPMFKRVSLELGGKNPNVVFADADFDEAVKGSVRAAFTNQGEICLCGSRIFVERSIHDRFVEAFAEETKRMRIGDPQDDGTEVGAVVSAQHRDKIEGYIALAAEEGGRVVAGGGRPSQLPERVRNGWFLEPTVVTGLHPRCRTTTEEIFGPVVTITPFDSEAEAIDAANATKYGLSATLWTADLKRAHRVAAAIDAGTVWINTWLLRDLRVPFGGMKESGLGREGGHDSLHFFTEAKTVCVAL